MKILRKKFMKKGRCVLNEGSCVLQHFFCTLEKYCNYFILFCILQKGIDNGMSNLPIDFILLH